MPLTHHPVRLFRLSCGCLRGYPMMPAGVQHLVLCITCRSTVLTTAVYPERCCGASGWARFGGQRLRVACTRRRGACVTGLHLDEYAAAVPVAFTVTGVPKLARSREGKTGRA
jgi:hypothetical protein